MTKGSLDRLHRLRQTDEVWEITARHARSWITPRDQAPYRPYIVLTISQIGQVVGSDITEDEPSPDHVLDVLAKAMRRPVLGGGGKRRPATIYVDDQALAEFLAPELQEIGIHCEYRGVLREVEQALLSMEQFMTKREPIPGLTKSPGVTPFLVNGLFTAAVSFYEEAPWRWIDDSRPIEVRYPLDSRPRYAVVMGHGGETYGLAAYNSPDELRQVYAGIPPDQLIGQVQWMSLLFGEMFEMPFDDLDDMEKYGLPVAGPLAYPLPIRINRSGQLIRPGKSELLWFEAALLAIPTFVEECMQAHMGIPRSAEITLTVTMADGEDQIHLSYPVPGFEVPYEEDWTALDEEVEAQSEAARVRGEELMHSFEQWLTSGSESGTGISKKTVQQHLENATLFALTYMADDGGSVAIPRPADQAEAVDVDEFLSEWLMQELAPVSVGTVTATIVSLEKFFACLKETGQMPAARADEILELLRVDQDYYIEIAQEYADSRHPEEEA
jgi:hypothetical protein